VYSRALPGSSTGSRQTCRSSTYNYYIYVFWHELSFFNSVSGQNITRRFSILAGD
jgi:hypothetical protein